MNFIAGYIFLCISVLKLDLSVHTCEKITLISPGKNYLVNRGRSKDETDKFCMLAGKK